MATTWADKDTARLLWRDAPADDAVLDLYLNAAQVACLAYAPLPNEDGEHGYGEVGYGGVEPHVPDHYILAQVLQARNIWNSGKAAPSGDFDGGSYGISAFPLDWQVKQLLRPQRGMGAVV